MLAEVLAFLQRENGASLWGASQRCWEKDAPVEHTLVLSAVCIIH
jgi:hypothetical protein